VQRCKKTQIQPKKTVKYKLDKPVLLYKKNGENEYDVIVDGNHSCTAKVSVGKFSKIKDIPLVNNMDLIMIDIPMNTPNRDSLVPSFPDNVKKLKDKQLEYLNYYHATYATTSLDARLCLSVNEKMIEKDYSVANFPSSVSNALLGLLIGNH